MIHQLTSIDPKAKVADGVTVEAFSTIYDDVEIGEGTWIGPNVTIMQGARIGKNCKIFPGAVISAAPQDLKYKGERTFSYVGDNTVIRECVTVNRGTEGGGGKTVIGSDSLIMATVHVAHDCIIGNHVVIVNGVGLAGHVEIADHCILGGFSGVHQFTKIGPHAMIAGGAMIRKDVPPYVKAARDPATFAGVNSLGLRRRGFSNEKIEEIQDMYRYIYQKKMNITQALESIENDFELSIERDLVLEFIKTSERGVIKGI